MRYPVKVTTSDLRLHLLAVIVTGTTLIACVDTVRTESFSDPTLPAPQWHLYGGLEIGYSLALPRTWSAFDLNTQLDLAISTCSRDESLKRARRPQITNLHDRGVRLFACDQSRDGDASLPVAYAVTGTAPAEPLDKYLDNQKQAAGREVVQRRHFRTNAGDMVLQDVRERLTANDGTVIDTTQRQFLVVRFSSLHLFIVEIPTALFEAVANDAEIMGTSFTPVR